MSRYDRSWSLESLRSYYNRWDRCEIVETKFSNHISVCSVPISLQLGFPLRISKKIPPIPSNMIFLAAYHAAVKILYKRKYRCFNSQTRQDPYYTILSFDNSVCPKCLIACWLLQIYFTNKVIRHHVTVNEWMKLFYLDTLASSTEVDFHERRVSIQIAHLSESLNRSQYNT